MTTQYQNTYTLNAYDILDRANSELSALASNAGIDWQKLHGLIDSSQTIYKSGIALDKKAQEGNPSAKVLFNETNGQEWPFITFKTFKHSGIKEVFNGWQWLKDNGYLSTHSEQPARPSVTPPKKPEPAKLTKVCADCGQEFTPKHSSFVICSKCYSFAYKLKRFNDTQKLFDTLPIAENSPYFERKGLNLSDIAHGLTIKRGQDKNGLYVIYPLRDLDRNINGFQQIYDSKVLNDGTNDKNYCFKPVRNEKGEVSTLKKQSFAVIGKVTSKQDKIYLCEGFATALSVHLATGAAVIVCLDTDGIESITKLFVKRGYTDLTIAADNDLKANDTGNAGIFAALKAVRNTGVKVVYPELDSKKIDFDDLRQASGLDAVKQQLDYKRPEFDHVRPEFLKDSFHYHLQLIKYAPEQQLKGVIARACSYVGHNKIATVSEFKTAYNRLRKAVKARHFDTGGYVRSLIKKYFNRRLEAIKTANLITDFSGVECHELNDNAAIAKLINSQDKAIFLDTRFMGAGKTLLMKEIADYWLGRSFSTDMHKHKLPVYVCHRVSLTSSASGRLNLEYYDDVLPGKGYKSLATCVNSIVKHEVSQAVKVLFIDESRQNLEHLLNGTCENRLAVYNELVAAIKNADLVIMADADFNQFTLDWVKSIANKPIHAITQKPAKTEKTIYQLGNHNAVLNHAKKALKSGLNVWIATDSMQQARKADIWLDSADLSEKETCESLMTELLKDSGLTREQVLLIHSENKGDPAQATFLANPNQESKKYRLVIHTPVISSGVSIEHNHFDCVYAMFSNVLACNEMLQTIGRVRPATEIFISFKENHPKDRPTSAKDLIQGHIIKVGRFNPDKFITEYDDFDRLRLEQIAARNHSLNNYIAEFKILSQLKGYRFEVLDTTKYIIKGLSKEAKQQKIDQIFTADQIEGDQVKAIDKKTATTQKESDQVHRFNVTQMTAKAHRDIDETDIEFYLNNGLSIISNYELIDADLLQLKEFDKNNRVTRDKQASKTSKHYLFKTIVGGLTGKKITPDIARGICEFLRDNHKELADNKMGNYAKVSKRPLKQLSDFLKKIGYELKLLEQEFSTGNRFYRIEVNPLVKQYAENRKAKEKAKKALFDAQDFSDFEDSELTV